MLRIWPLSIFVLFYSVSAFTAIPTVEGLFRNGFNSDVQHDTIIYKFQIEEIENNNAESKVTNVDTNSSTDTGTDGDVTKEGVETTLNKGKVYGKIIFGLHKEDQISAIYSIYSSPNMNGEDLLDTVYIKNWEEFILSDELKERALFFSIISSGILNRSKTVVSLLKQIDSSIRDNTELLNHEKLLLFKNYRNYLLAIKSDESLKVTLTSPYKPENEVDQKKVEELKKAEMYNKTEKVFLVKKGNTFRWKVELANFEAFFSNNTHQFERLNWKSEEGTYFLRFHNYVLFDGVHMLPKDIILSNKTNRIFRVKNSSLKHFSNKNKTMDIRFKEDYQTMKDKITREKSEIDLIKEKFKVFILHG